MGHPVDCKNCICTVSVMQYNNLIRYLLYPDSFYILHKPPYLLNNLHFRTEVGCHMIYFYIFHSYLHYTQTKKTRSSTRHQLKNVRCVKEANASINKPPVHISVM